ncbi:FtsX-like permease family protein [Umezawaea beigongshangensis]|uniref:FtsX-like permease family protein n=1 Tax=Umezawaea beigongshangensis TaxID=2780383 RepID=UPI001E304591|nr:FtsX-like permease family protein [Umezawaea beigongshangensis]
MSPLTVLRLGTAEFRAHPGRALLPGVALVVGIACLVAALVLSAAMVSATGAGRPVAPEPVTAVVEIAHSDSAAAEAELDETLIARIGAVPGVRRVLPVERVRVDLLLADGRAGPRRATGDVELDEDALRRVPIAEGRSPRADGEIAVDRVTAHEHDLRPGSVVAVADAEGRPRDVVVSGTTKRGGMVDEPVLVLGPDLARALDREPARTQLHVLGGDPAAVQAAAGPAYEVLRPDGGQDRGNDSDALSGLLLTFSVLALATAVFVASATFRAVHLQRQRRTALLRCLGANRAPLVVGSLAESLVTGVSAGAVGALLGAPLGRLLGQLFDSTGVSAMFGAVELRPPLAPQPVHVVLGVVVAAVLSAVAAVRPALAASRVSPLAALRSSDGLPPAAAVRRRRNVLGVVLVVLAAALAALGVLAGGSLASIFLLLAASVLGIAGLFVVLGPVVVPALGLIFGSVAARIGGPHWRLAAAEVRRVPQRSASVAVPLVLASALVTSGAVLLTSAQSLADQFENEPRPDAVITDVGPRPLPARAERVAELPGVAAHVALHEAEITGDEPDSLGLVLGADPADLRAWARAQGFAAEDFGPDTVLLANYVAQDLGAQLGQPVTLRGLPGGPRTATFAGTLPFTALQGADAVLPDTGLGPVTTAWIALDEGTDALAFRDAVRAALPDAPTVQVETGAGVSEENDRYLGMATIMMMVLLGLSVAVAVTGIGTALAISVQERRKELALRRALGVTRGGVQGGVVAEAVLLALVGVLGGGLYGLLCSELLMLSFGVLHLPWSSLGPLLAGGAVVVALAVLSAVGPARTAARVRPAAGLAAG